MIIERIPCFVVCNTYNHEKWRRYDCLYFHWDGRIVYFFCQHILRWSVRWLGMYINRLTPNRTKVFVEKMPMICEVTYYFNRKFKLSLTSVLMGRLSPSSKGTCLSLIILHHLARFHQNQSRTFWDNRGKRSQKNTHRDRHIHADKNNIKNNNKQSFWAR